MSTNIKFIQVKAINFEILEIKCPQKYHLKKKQLSKFPIMSSLGKAWKFMPTKIDYCVIQTKPIKPPWYTLSVSGLVHILPSAVCQFVCNLYLCLVTIHCGIELTNYWWRCCVLGSQHWLLLMVHKDINTSTMRTINMHEVFCVT